MVKRLSDKKKRLFRAAKPYDGEHRWAGYHLTESAYKNVVYDGSIIVLAVKFEIPRSEVSEQKFWNVDFCLTMNALIRQLTDSGRTVMNSEFSKIAKEYYCVIFDMIFEQSLEYVSPQPHDWKIGRAILLHKTGDRKSR